MLSGIGGRFIGFGQLIQSKIIPSFYGENYFFDSLQWGSWIKKIHGEKITREKRFSRNAGFTPLTSPAAGYRFSLPDKLAQKPKNSFEILPNPGFRPPGCGRQYSYFSALFVYILWLKLFAVFGELYFIGTAPFVVWHEFMQF